MPPESYRCPRCSRPIVASGSLVVAGESASVYQCDECLVTTEMFGESVEVAYTFAVDARGRVFDPAAEDDHAGDN